MSDKTVVEKLREEAKHAREERGLPVYTPDQLESLADTIEREYLPRPRLDNGEPVQVGDHFTWAGDRRDLKVSSIKVMVSWNNDTSSANAGYFEKKAKRTEPEVLDANGVPINVGDTVYIVSNPTIFSKSSGFAVLKVDTIPEPRIRIEMTKSDGSSIEAWMNPLDLTHKQPDSLERIEADAEKNVCVYFDKQGSTKCSGCDKSLHPYLECNREMMLDLMKRQREVLERDHER